MEYQHKLRKFIEHDAVHVGLSAESVDGELMRTYEGWLNLLADEALDTPSLKCLIVNIAALPISQLKGVSGANEIVLSDIWLTTNDATTVSSPVCRSG